MSNRLHARYLIAAVFLAAPCLAQLEVEASHWPAFRGERARGVAEGRALPLEWDVPADEAVHWRTPIPGLAHSNPIVWGRRLVGD